MILITRPRKNSLEFQKKLEKLKIISKIQELSKFRIIKGKLQLSNCIILVTSPRSLDYLIKSKTIESCKQNAFMVIGKKTTQRLKQLGCKKIIISAQDSAELIKKSKTIVNEGSDIQFLCSNTYNKELVKFFKKIKCKITLIKVYETIKVKKLNKSVIKNLRDVNFSSAVFFSKFSLEVFFELCRSEKISRSSLKKIQYICISQRVGEFAANRGFSVHYPSNPFEQSIYELIKQLKLK